MHQSTSMYLVFSDGSRDVYDVTVFLEKLLQQFACINSEVGYVCVNKETLKNKSKALP